jgi:hypothetical protein
MKEITNMTKPRKGYDGWRDGKGQVGIDSNKDANFGKMRKGSDPWEVRPASSVDGARGDGVRRKDTVKSGRGIDDDIGVGILRNKPADDQSGGAGNRDIWSDVSKNSDDVSGTGGTGPVKYGVD